MAKFYLKFGILTMGVLGIISCKNEQEKVEDFPVEPQSEAEVLNVSSEPLITDNFTADPSAHVFQDKLYIYPSHDYYSGIPEDDLGSHFNMRDYHVYSMDSVGGKITDHGVALDVKDVKWAKRQMWAPDAAEKDGKYYLYFPAKDKDDIFRIGVATSDNPGGPFVALPEPIENTFSIDPAVFKDSDNEYYLYFGGIWGGQLQRWQNDTFEMEDAYPADTASALKPKIAKLNSDMVSLAETPRDIQILDENGKELTTGDNERRFFEAAWVHKMNGKYYLSYSTGDTHNIAYAVGDSPYGPFTYKGVILKPVLGWTNHHSIVEFKGKWYLFYHDSSLSGGKTYLRSIKMTELKFNDDGSIRTIDAMVSNDGIK
ncbi:glycoside hydrolase family 43 protein [Gillisia sp. M10.2A]|uniref:Glycoside hydrolase family 43 protein n=1 Tax=Gillisia lutea TaxID=2909668 RepID=A0ABS9EI27_9FLAO|nr:glycoside hydrolase family 43 protein [Gillisia lutea]MCF4101101.1 glycoside hydrolase family 43 protein [Gillisia lutea]